MAGFIIGCFGKQRSGKTLIAYKAAKSIKEAINSAGQKIRVYTNLYCPADTDFIYINNVDDLPLDLEPKIVLIDEIYNGLDAQDYRSLKEVSIYLNTLGKQNCLFIFTSIEEGMVYNRLRTQMNMAILVKGSPETIAYKVIDMDTLGISDYIVKKSPELFRNVNYDTNFIPVDFDWGMKSWKQKLIKFYSVHYGITVNF